MFFFFLWKLGEDGIEVFIFLDLGIIHLVVILGEEVFDIFCLGHVREVSHVEASALGDGLEGAGVGFAAGFGFTAAWGWRCFCHGIIIVMLGALVLEIRSLDGRRWLSLGAPVT